MHAEELTGEVIEYLGFTLNYFRTIKARGRSPNRIRRILMISKLGDR